MTGDLRKRFLEGISGVFKKKLKLFHFFDFVKFSGLQPFLQEMGKLRSFNFFLKTPLIPSKNHFLRSPVIQNLILSKFLLHKQNVLCSKIFEKMALF